MAASSIKNPSVEICAMPAPFQGVLKGGQTVILSYTPAQLETMCPSLSDAFIVTDLGSYSGATDDADFGPITDEATTFEAPVAIAPAAVSSAGQVALTVTGAADTGITASTERSDVYLNLARTETWATGALATQRAIRIAAPTYAFVGASVITTAATLSISGAPVAGANATITNAYALHVAGGRAQFAGLLAAGAGLSITGQITAETVDASGTPGAAVINAPTGTVAIAIGADNVVVTNNLVTANSIVIPVLQFVDATLTQILSCVPGPGSFTITGNAVATAATRVSFIVIN